MYRSMEECKHGLNASFCSYCKDPRIVYLSGGGSVYHRSIDCGAMEKGKQKVLDSGGELAHVDSTTQSNAEVSGRRPCRSYANAEATTKSDHTSRRSPTAGHEKTSDGSKEADVQEESEPDPSRSEGISQNGTVGTPQSPEAERMGLSTEQRRILELPAAGHSFDQILASSPGVSYLDIFESVQAALDALDEPAYSVEEVRKRFPNAYRPWDEHEEAELRTRALRHESIEEMASALGRSAGAVQSRLIGLLLDDSDGQ